MAKSAKDNSDFSMVSHEEQSKTWPLSGKHILAQFDDASIVVYQAYNPPIGSFAATHNFFGGDFSYGRMSWIKPNFLWMMYRSGWGTKPGQEVTLAIRLKRTFFEELLEVAVPSGYVQALYESREEWQSAVKSSDVRLQWDPDHAPDGKNLKRKAIQIGIRGEMLRRYGKEEIISITDISNIVSQGREALKKERDSLQTPQESVFMPTSQLARDRIGL